MVNPLSVRDAESIVRTVLRDYGLDLRIDDVAYRNGRWEIVLRANHTEIQHLSLPPNTPHGLRQALMSALEIE
jgi:hypothetical protein